jgi:membrane protein
MRQVAMQVPTHVRTAWDAATYIARSAIRHRLSGHAAEISFFALLSLIPVTVAIGAALKLVSQTMGPDIADQGREGAIDTIRLLIGPTLADSVVGPFVRAQLTQQDSGVAVGGLIVAWWLFGRLFTSMQHGLDKAYGVSDRRSSLHNRMIALASSAAGLIAIVVTLTLMVLGWRGNKHGIDKWLASVPIAADIWNIVRWPILVLILVGLLVGLYRYSPNVRHRWRDCLPGAALGVLLWVGAAALFRAYLMFGSGAPTGVRSDDSQVVLIGRAVGASIGTAVFIYFSTIAILLGAEVNALIIRYRKLTAPSAKPPVPTVPLPAAGPPPTPAPKVPAESGPKAAPLLPAAGPVWPPPPPATPMPPPPEVPAASAPPTAPSELPAQLRPAPPLLPDVPAPPHPPVPNQPTPPSRTRA